MGITRGLVVLSGAQAHREGNWLVVSEGMIMSMVGLAQLFEPRGISLNQLHLTLDRVREGMPRVDWYALRDSLAHMENDGQLKSLRRRRGNLSYNLYTLADWEEWWRLHSRLL